MKRIAVLVNKGFEYEGFIEGLRQVVRPYAGTNGRDAECVLGNVAADIYCIHNLFPEGESSSNSERKAGLLADLFRSKPFRLGDLDAVVSFSTSESTPAAQEAAGKETLNGCVYVGNRFFLSDQGANDPTTKSRLPIGNGDGTERYDDAPACEGLYETLNSIPMKLPPVRMNPDMSPRCVASRDFACVGVVNVMDYSKYKEADPAAYWRFLSREEPGITPVGIETTHGVVKKVLEQVRKESGIEKGIPVTFVSPITDRYMKFDDDVDPDGWQNFRCSYNGGMATGHLLEAMDVLMTD